MATAEWPAFLPLPEQGGYRVARGRNRVSIRLEGGPSRVRQTSLGTPHEVAVTWVCDESEYAGVIGFLRERTIERTLFFRLPLIIDVPVPVPYLCRLLDEPEALESVQGLLFEVRAALEVIPNPIRSSTILLQNVDEPRVTAANTAQGYSPDMAEFPDGRQVMLVGCRGTSSGTAVDLDGTYTIADHPTPESIELQSAATVNSDWTVLNGTLSQALSPDKQGGAVILIPE
jgi:hypothetical protein